MADAPFLSGTDFCIGNRYWRSMSAKQWVITTVIEGEFHPFDYVAEFLENIRVRGDYTVISSVTTPASDIAGSASPADSPADDNAKYPTFGDIIDGLASAAEILDGHDYPSVYAGYRRGHTGYRRGH